MLEFSQFARCADGVLRPAQEHCYLGNIEGPRPVLEHLWNTIFVHGWGRLVMGRLRWSWAARTNSLGW